ncbi:hypothetical protein [Algicola sagamiensis]|uniref:hypothetical protein n=1 Tax=Algicola sagamiensis TaxID=163869 RepID=UPI00035C7F1F|nr:hypothetical protein [Algicola sagamiensis]
MKLEIGKRYRAKSPKEVIGYFNDRYVTSIVNDTVFYRTPESFFLEERVMKTHIEEFFSWVDTQATPSGPDELFEVWQLSQDEFEKLQLGC